MVNSGLETYQKTCKEAVAANLAGKRRAIRHLRGKGGRILATLLAVEEHGTVYVGWSKCNQADPFNRSVGIMRAFRRKIDIEAAEHYAKFGYTHWYDGAEIPHVVRKAMSEFIQKVRERHEEGLRKAREAQGAK